MNYVDIFLLALFAYTGFRGFRGGFVIEVFSTLSLFIGLYGAIHFSDHAGDWLRENAEFREDYVPAMAFIITFLALVIAVHFIARAVSKLINVMAMGLINKILGFIFAVFKAALIVSVLLMLLHRPMDNLEFPSKETRNESLLFQPVKSIAPTLLPAIRDTEFYKYFEKQKWSLDQIELPSFSQ